MTLAIMAAYLLLLLGLGLVSNRLFTGKARDYFLASHSIGPVVLLMSLFGTTMTAFALIGSAGEAFNGGIAVYGMMASWSGLIHAAVFFLVGIRLWAFGKKYGYTTQIQYFRDRFDSPALGAILFPILIVLIVPYLLVGLLGAGMVVNVLTLETFPVAFESTQGGLPPWLTGLVISAVVMTYIFLGGMRAAAWANTFQTIVFMTTGFVAFWVIASKLGGLSAATRAVADNPEMAVRLIRGGEGQVSHMQFITYAFIPLSVGMFPHVFQHWLTARSAKTFRLSIVVQPIFIMLVWLPCVLIGVWATTAMFTNAAGELVSAVPASHPPNSELAFMVRNLTSPALAGILGAGILAAIMSSLDSQFFCMGTIFTSEINHYFGKDRFSDRQQVLFARGFIVLIVLITYLFSLQEPRQVFQLGIWCFSGFTGLFPLVVASIYWKRVTTPGAIASILASAAVWLILFRESDYGAIRGYLFLGMMPVATIFACATAALIGVSLLTRPPRKETIAKYFVS